MLALLQERDLENRDVICSRAHMCACYEVEEETNETPHLHAPALYASRTLTRDKKRRDETAARLFCNAFRGWSSKKEIFNAKPSNQLPQSITLLPIHFFDSRLKFAAHSTSKWKTASGLAKCNSRLYRLNSTFYNGIKVSTETPSAMIASLFACRIALGKVASKGDIED